ncbi:MAG: Ig-like domain-containing protein [Myxococcales bacterium]
MNGAGVVKLPGGAWTLEGVEPGAHGTTALLGADQLSYQPAADFHGADRFEFTLRDVCGAASTGSVLVKVMTPFTWTGQNRRPLERAQELVRHAHRGHLHRGVRSSRGWGCRGV